ncbi:MAG: DNA repair exonuclease [Candidatus Woesearchaeota archaeon]
MRFIHIADCHLGGWRDPTMRELNRQAFSQVITGCNVDFVLISGDLFNTAVPTLDTLKFVFSSFQQLKQKGIPVYLIPGSHDYSPTGKTMLDLLDVSGLAYNVAEKHAWHEDVLIAGIQGLRGSLEKDLFSSFESLDAKQKIFMFHSGLAEFHDFSELSVKDLPGEFMYYAGGHIHQPGEFEEDGKKIVFPGPLFPNNFKELELLQGGGYYLYEDGKTSFVPVNVCKVHPLMIDCEGLEAEEIEEEVCKEGDFSDTVVTLRLFGGMKGKTSEINYKKIYAHFYSRNALFVMKNTSKLASERLDEGQKEASVPEIEKGLIGENYEFVKSMMQILSAERGDMKVNDFEEKIASELDSLMKSFK